MKQDTRIHSSAPTYKAPQRRGMSAMLRRLAVRRTAHALSALALGAILVPHAQAASLTWDSDANAGNGATDGSGTWDPNTTLDWYNGATDQTWGNPTAPPNTAIFGAGGTSGTVTIAGTINVGGITFNQGGYTLTGGTLNLIPSGGPFVYTTNGGTTTINSAITSAGGALITKTGAGTLVLNSGGGGTGTTPALYTVTGGTFNSTTKIFDSILAFPAGNRLGVQASSPTVVLTLDAGTLQTTTATGNALATNRTAQVNAAGGAISDFGSGNFYQAAIINNAGAASSLYLSNISGMTQFQGAISGSGSITWNGVGTGFFSGANTYNGGTAIVGGTLEFAKTQAMPTTGAVTVASGATLALGVGGAGDFSNATSGPSSIGGILALGATTFASGSAIGIDTTDGSISYAGVIANEGVNTLGVTKLGTNTLTLTATNTYTGGTTINAGTLAVGNDSALGTGTATIKDGGTLANNDSAAHTLSNAMTLSGTTQGVTFAGSQNLTLTGAFSSAAAVKITKTGSSVLTLSNDNSGTIAANASWNVTGGNYSSATGIYDSVLAVNSGRALGSGTGNLLTLDAGTLQFTANGGTGYANSRTINVTANGGAINDGGFAFGEATSGGGTFNPFIGVASGAGLNLVSSNKLQYSGVISGSGSVNTFATGTGSVILLGSSTYSGGTTINAGTLALAGAANSNSTTGTGRITVKGAGVSGASAASGSQGVLQLNASNQIANAAAITLAGGTLNANGNSEGAAGATPTTGLGALTMTTSSGNFSFLDFGPTTSGSNTLAFADSSATNGGTFGTNQTLQVLGYQYGDAGTFDHLYFGTVTGGGLTPTQLSQISFVNINGVAGNNAGATMLANGEIAPTPEPGSVIPIIIGMAGLGILIARKRRKVNAKNCQNELAEAV